MNEDIIAAVVEYLQSAMAVDLEVGSVQPWGINPGVWADYAGQTIDGMPYAVVHDGPESYIFQSDSVACSVISDGFLFVGFVAPTKQLARQLAIKCVRLLVDTVVELDCADGVVIHLRPTKTETIGMTDIGPAVPGTFKRVVTVEYRQQWPSP